MVSFTHSGHGVYFAEYHVCWCTKYRRRILNPALSVAVRKILFKHARIMNGVLIKEIGIDLQMRDHLHLIMVIPPKFSPSAVVGELKARSASELRSKYLWLSRVYWHENVVWSPGFFLSTVGVNQTVIRNYVKHQGEQDSGVRELSLFDSVH